MAARNQITINQVARQAGVSAQTVSRVINDRPDVAPQTRKRVQETIALLGYRPNAIARSLIHRRSHTLGVVATGLDYYGPSRALMGIEKETRARGYSLLLDLQYHPETENVEQLLNRLLSRQVDGILWAVSEIGNNRLWLEQNPPNLPVPMVFLTMQPRLKWVTVSIDNLAGGFLATRHLIEQGYRKIGIVLGPLDWWEVRQRKLGWQEALAETGLSYAEHQAAQGDWSSPSGEQAFLRLVDQYPEMDAVFACNDQMALGVLKAARMLGRRVPEDLAIVGFDNIPESAYYWPALTTIEQPLIELGSLAVSKLNQMIEAEQQNVAEVSGESSILQPKLIVRESSRQAAEGI